VALTATQQREVDRLDALIVEGEADLAFLRELRAQVLKVAGLAAPEPATGEQEAADARRVQSERLRAAKRRRKGLKPLLKDVMGDYHVRDVDQIIEAVKILQVYSEGDFPPRLSFTNRLRDLVMDGYLENPSRGVYRRAPMNGEPGHELKISEGAARSS
jgi:hypothetical protein